MPGSSSALYCVSVAALVLSKSRAWHGYMFEWTIDREGLLKCSLCLWHLLASACASVLPPRKNRL